MDSLAENTQTVPFTSSRLPASTCGSELFPKFVRLTLMNPAWIFCTISGNASQFAAPLSG
jgi:hypothetical protein